MEIGSYVEAFRTALSASDVRFMARADLEAVNGGPLPDEALGTLRDAGLIEEVLPDAWLVLTGERPRFDVPRFWSNPSLSDPLTICALVASNPTILDVTRAILAYGIVVMRRALVACEGEVEEGRLDAARAMTENAWRGVTNAARRRAAA